MIEIKKRTNITRYPIYGRDKSSVLVSLLRLGTILILLRGLRTLRVLRDLRLGTEGISWIMPTITIEKSKTFQ